MRKIKDYENKMVHNGKRNERFVLIPCDHCGEKVWKKWHSRIKRGDAQYCNKECFDGWQRKISIRKHGIENAKFTWDKSRCVWVAYWYDDNNKRYNTTKAKWLWEKHHGDVPKGYWVTYKDGNSENCELDNLELISRGERMSKALTGHKHSDEAKRNMSKAHTGKTLSDGHRKKIGKASRKMWEDGIFDAPHIREAYAKQGRATKGSKRTDEQKAVLSRIQKERHKRDPQARFVGKKSGKDHYKWRGGSDIIKYPAEFSKSLRKMIRSRDGYKCRLCKKSARGMKGHVHHINGDRLHNDEENLILVCTKCHSKIHGKSLGVSSEILAFRSMLHWSKY